MDDAKDAIRGRLSQVKTFLAQEAPPRLSESDTKANFIEPIIASLGWEGIGVVTREYYVRNSQEFIDYIMTGPGGLLLAIEAKPLQTDLTDKHAAQLIQYCAVEGIEWAALTNGRELQFFNTFLKPDLAAKRVLRLDLLAFNSDAEFDALFGQVWQLSRESMTTPSGVRSWLNQRRLDTALRAILLDAGSPTVRYLRRVLADRDINATAQDLAQWFRSHLGTPITALPVPPRQRQERPTADLRSRSIRPVSATPSLGQATTLRGASEPPPIVAETDASALASIRRKVYHGVSLRDLIGAGFLQPGTTLVLVARGRRVVERAELTAAGEIAWQGRVYRSPSDDAFAPALGVTKFNGWQYWHAELPQGRESLAHIRARLQDAAHRDAATEDASS